MLIRTRLLLLGLATLALPWAGCQYAREMEASLRAAESEGLRAVAQTIATSLQGRSDLLYRSTGGQGSRAPAGPFDLEPVPLSPEPQLDGRDDDWPRVQRAWRTYGTVPRAAPEPALREVEPVAVLAGTAGRFLFVLLRVRDTGLVLDASDASALDPAAMGDRIWLGFATPRGELDQVFLSGWTTGDLRGRRIVTREFGRAEMADEPRVQGAWVRSPEGWTAELRIPLSMIADRFGVLVDDRARRGGEPRPMGSLAPGDLAPRGRLIAAAPELTSYLTQFAQPGVRIVAASPAGATLAEADALPLIAANSGAQALLSRLYRRFLDRAALAERITETERGRIDRIQAESAAAGRSSSAVFATSDERRMVVAAAAPIRESATGPVLGVLQVAQTADRWLLLRDRALTRLLNLTLLATLLVVGLIAVFGTRLAIRLERLRRASDAALTRDGRVHSAFPDVASKDELGAVARGFSALLERLDGYTSYLRTLAGKLAHEIRTPLTIVRSSLENLGTEPLSAPAREYLQRAREGSDRLGQILQAMGSATRVEEAIEGAEFVDCDLAAVLTGAAHGYSQAFPARRFAVVGAETACPIHAAPDLLLQMLDKLVDNAVDFSPVDSTITFRLVVPADSAQVAVEVDNVGPRLPPGSASRIFESLWQARVDRGDKPHFGLGLYIVRLIARRHGGWAEAEDLPDNSGVRFRVWLRRVVAQM